MNTSQPPAPKQSHPLSGVGCWLLAPRAETETRTRAGDNSDTCHAPPKVAGIAGGARSSPSRQRTYPLSGRMGNGLGYPDRDARTGLFPVAPCALNAVASACVRMGRQCRQAEDRSSRVTVTAQGRSNARAAFTNSQRVSSAPHFQATGAALLRLPPTSLPVELAGRVFGPPLFSGVA